MKNNVNRGLMVGRFQPFHRGHLFLVEKILEDCNEIIIVVGSAQLNYKFTNPFTAGERILMIHRALLESHLDLAKVFIIPLIDDDNNARWLSYLYSMVPSFDILYSGNELVSTLGSPQIKVIKPEFIKKKQYNGSNIRNMMANAKNWKELVPNAVFSIVEEIAGPDRVKRLASYEQVEFNKSIHLHSYRTDKKKGSSKNASTSDRNLK